MNTFGQRIKIVRTEQTVSHLDRSDVIQLLLGAVPAAETVGRAAILNAMTDHELACELEATWEANEDMDWIDSFLRAADKNGVYGDEWQFGVSR